MDYSFYAFIASLFVLGFWQILRIWNKWYYRNKFCNHCKIHVMASDASIKLNKRFYHLTCLRQIEQSYNDGKSTDAEKEV